MPEFGEPLSDRELDVLKCLSMGAGNKEIAGELHISQNTVKVHLRNIYTKLGASSRTEATAVALQKGFISLPGIDTTVPEIEAESDRQSSPIEAVPEGESLPDENDRWFGWRFLWLGLGILLLLILGIPLISRWQSATANPPNTPEPFVPEELGENWKGLRPLPEPRSGMATAAVGLNIYQIGGETIEGVDGKVLVYHTIDHAWQEAAEKPTDVTDASAVELFGEIFVPGGRLPDGQPTDIVEAYSPTNDSWRPIESLPELVAGGLTLTDGSFLYLIGGWNGEKYLNTIFVYDPAQDSWDELPAMTQARANLMGGAVAGNLYAVGGTDGQKILSSCEYFNLTESTWFACPDMLAPRANGGSASFVNKIYVIGGGSGDEATDFSEFYDPVTEQWEEIETPIVSEKEGWTDLGVTNVEARLFAFGGLEASKELLAESYIYAPQVYKIYIPAASVGGE